MTIVAAQDPLLFTDGHALLSAMDSAIRDARDRVWIETFILGPDDVGSRFIDLAAEAARRGCDVRVVLDHLGSPIAGMGQYRPIEEAGGEVLLYNPLPPWRRFGRKTGSLAHRDHRKIIVADDVAFTGGHNLSTAYLSNEATYTDASIRLDNKAAHGLAEVFEQTCALARGDAMRFRDEIESGGVITLAHDLRRGLTAPERALTAMLERAERQVLITLAYFVPPAWLVDAMAETAGRGVDVRLLTAGKTDVPIARQGGRHAYDRLLGAGIRIFEYTARKLHAKNVVVDDRHVLIGSFDFNAFSRRHSLEVAVACESEPLAAAVREVFERNVGQSREIDAAGWARRSDFERATERWSYRLFHAWPVSDDEMAGPRPSTPTNQLSTRD